MCPPENIGPLAAGYPAEAASAVKAEGLPLASRHRNNKSVSQGGFVGFIRLWGPILMVATYKELLSKEA